MNITMNKPAMRTIGTVVVSVLLSWMLFIPANSVRAAAPTDEELKALEKQIEQQEAEQAEAKKKAEAEAKLKIEVERKGEEAAKKQAEAEAARQAAEEKHKAEESTKQAEEAKNKLEQDKREKYSALVNEAEQAVRNKDQEVAVAKYKEALALYPDEAAPKAGLAEAEKLPDKVCRDFPGKWEYSATSTMTFNPDGTWQGLKLFIPISGTWICDSKTHVIEIKSALADVNAVLREDGCLAGIENFGRGCFRKKSGNDGKTQDKR